MSPRSRPVSVISSEAPLPEVLTALSKALGNSGPAITISSPQLPVSELSAPPEIALVVATSGSTGTPRNVALTAAALRSSAHSTHQYLGAMTGQYWSLRLPLTHIAGAMVLVRSLELGTLPIVNGMSESADCASADFESIVPTQLHRAITRDPELLRALQSARAVLVGGAALSKDLLVRSIELGINVITTYGMSETAGGCIYNNEPLSDVQIRLTRDSRIELKGPMLASGYLQSDGAIENFSDTDDGWFTTADLGEISPDHRLRVLGRADDIAITGGVKVSLSEVERVLSTHPEISEALCAVIENAEWGQRIIVGIVANSPISLTEIRDYVGARIGRISAPRAIVRLQEIPLRGIGKPDRDALAKMQFDEEI